MLPLRSIPQPLTGPQLCVWARDFTPRFGLDLMEMVKAFGRSVRLETDITRWSIADVTDCMAHVAKALDERGLLDIPPEARAQMESRVRASIPRDPHRPQPGPLTLQSRDPLLDPKQQILGLLKALYVAEHRSDPTEAQALLYLQARCKAHSLVPPDSLRDLHRREHVYMILSVLREDVAEMRRLS